MANDMNIGVNISADTRQFNAGMKNVQGGLTQSGASMSKFAAGGVAAMAAIGVAAAAAGAAVFASFIKKSTSVFIDFEASLTKTAAIMGKTSKDELPEIEAEIKALGRETK